VEQIDLFKSNSVRCIAEFIAVPAANSGKQEGDFCNAGLPHDRAELLGHQIFIRISLKDVHYKSLTTLNW
jgi:hypothetical protein